jgi:3'(2'), 5'-bisphosphate nucleotidase
VRASTTTAERELACRAVESAARLCRAVQDELALAPTLTKGDRSPVTIADFGAQAVVSLTLREGGAGLPIVGEERAAALRTEAGAALARQVVGHVQRLIPGVCADEVLDAIDACCDPGGATGRRWVLDPIDGTKGYLRRGQYAIALALLEDGVPLLGVLGCPELEAAGGGRGLLFVAAAGEGAEERALDAGPQARAICTDGQRDPRRAVLCESVEAAHSAHDRSARIAERLGIEAEPVRIDSQCKYAVLARGGASIYLRLPRTSEYQEKIWDHAAGWVVLTEAGGRVTDAEGRPLDFSLGRTLARNRGIVATNGPLHDVVLEAVLASAPEVSA